MPVGWMLFAIRMTVCVQGQEIAQPGAWTKARMSEAAKLSLGLEDVISIKPLAGRTR